MTFFLKNEQIYRFSDICESYVVQTFERYFCNKTKHIAM